MKFENEKNLTEQTKEHLAQLLFDSSYLEYCSVGNKLKLHIVELQILQNINPYIDLCNILYNDANEIVGFYIAGTLDELTKIEVPSSYRDEIQVLDNEYNSFIHGKLYDTDYFLSSVAIDNKFRNQGLYRVFHEEVLKQAKNKKCNRIVLTVWETSKAVPIYLKYGFTIVDTFEYPYQFFFENLLLMELNL